MLNRIRGAGRAPGPGPDDPGDPAAGHSIRLEFPIRPEPRWGHGRPPHPELLALVEAGREGYAEVLADVLRVADDLAAIAVRADGSQEPAWHNPYFFGLDAASLYGLLSARNPALMVEVGSGFSTRFARRAIRDHGLRTRLVSIDPDPRAAVDGVADEVVASRLEDAPQAALERLGPGDILFLDGSHYVFMNTDVTVAFLEVIPRLAAGVLVHVHDVFLPSDYRPDWAGRNYSEQYLLAAYLLGGDHLKTLLPAYFVYGDPALAAILDPLWQRLGLSGYETAGHSYWLTRA